jgi:membrane protease YdiL (CAAX protease family)
MAGEKQSWLSRYLRETRRPVYSAALVLPFFFIYHTGTVVFRTTYINGADALIIRLLSLFSVRSMFASAVVLLLCFVVRQLRTGSSWRLDPNKLALLFAESLLFAVLLFFSFSRFPLGLSRPAAGAGRAAMLQQLVLYCGAGIYEELLFRAFLLSILMLGAGRLLHLGKFQAAAGSVVAASVLFSLFHYVGPGADRFSLGGFFQRALGGSYFSLLFVTRGFGVTAASHALYDMIVGLAVV